MYSTRILFRSLILAMVVVAKEMHMDSALERDLSLEFSNVNGLQPRELTNLQTFTQALGGAAAPPITNSGTPARPYSVDGDTFTDFGTASTRTCNNQHNACADIANDETKNTAGITVDNCGDQEAKCLSAQASATATGFQVLVSSDAQFDYICDGNI